MMVMNSWDHHHESRPKPEQVSALSSSSSSTTAPQPAAAARLGAHRGVVVPQRLAQRFSDGGGVLGSRGWGQPGGVQRKILGMLWDISIVVNILLIMVDLLYGYSRGYYMVNLLYGYYFYGILLMG